MYNNRAEEAPDGVSLLNLINHINKWSPRSGRYKKVSVRIEVRDCNASRNELDTKPPHIENEVLANLSDHQLRRPSDVISLPTPKGTTVHTIRV
jgi:flagellar basal body-associated protein FliL